MTSVSLSRRSFLSRIGAAMALAVAPHLPWGEELVSGPSIVDDGYRTGGLKYWAIQFDEGRVSGGDNLAHDSLVEFMNKVTVIGRPDNEPWDRVMLEVLDEVESQ